MAGSSTQSRENFTAQGMEQHQIMMNTEVMKHFGIMNRASVREIMLQHEKTFKEQVHDLHKLYEVQRFLMDKAKGRRLDAYLGGPPPQLPGCGNAKSEETYQLGQRRNFWEQVTPNGTQKAASEKTMRWEDTLKSVNSPVRKRKIDLEQLPEDDSDDELENSVGALNPTSSTLSGNSRELTNRGGHSGFASVINTHASRSVGNDFQPSPPVNDSQVSSLLMVETSLYGSNVNGSRPDSCFPSHSGKAPNLAPNVLKTEQNLTNVVKTEQNLTNLGERNMSFQNASILNADLDTIKSSGTVFLPQPDLINRASQEVGRESHWFVQASDANTAKRSSKFPLQHRPHLALPEQSINRSQIHNGILQGSPNSEQRHHNKKSPPLESVSSILGDWNKVPVEQQSPGLPMGAQKDRAPFGASERSGDASRWFSQEPLSQGPLANVIPMARFETRASEGGHALPGIVAPAIAVVNNKGSSQERDTNTSWPSQNPILQLPQYQQPSMFQPQVFPSVNQAVWLQSSQNTQNSLYSQQVVYGIHPSDTSQIGYRADSLQRNQGDIASPWNVVGLGHYYSSVPPTPQKRPFKKPPKLVLKNDGVGMELKLVSPEKEMSEKAIQKKPLNLLKKDSSQDSSKSCERKGGSQKEEDQKYEKRNKSAVEILGSVVQGGEPPRTLSALESRPLASAVPLVSQEIISPKESTLSHNAAAAVALSAVSQCDGGAVSSTMQSVSDAGLMVSASAHTLKNQHCASQAEKVLPSRDQEKMAEECLPDLKSAYAACIKETIPWTKADIDRDMQGEKLETSSLQCKDEMGAGHRIMIDLKALSSRELMSDVNAADVAATGESESFDVTPQATHSKSMEESVVGVNMRQQHAQKLAIHNHELGQPKGSHLASCATADISSKEGSKNRGLFQGSSLGHSADLTIPSSSQPIAQAVSMQSTSTDTPNTTKQDKKCSSKVLENSATRKVSGKSSNACRSGLATPTSDRDCLSAPTLTSLMSESSLEAMVGVSSADIHHDSDTDNLAATILLSFAPMIDLQNEEKHSKGNVAVISGTGLKDRPTDRPSSKTSRSTESASGLQSEDFNSGGGQGRRMAGQGSFRRTDRHDRHEPMKLTVKDKFRREERKEDEQQADNGGGDVTKSIMIKLPRVAGTLNDESIPISRSKQLSKLNGVADTADYTKTSKGNDAFHTPTGRRSSRGPAMAARVPHESRARLHQQTQHRLEGNPTEKDSRSREEGGGMRNKPEGNMKSKAWGDINRTRSHPRKQFQISSHRKTQK